MRTAILLILILLTLPAESHSNPNQTWSYLRNEGLAALKDKNYKEAGNKLKGALLTSLKGKQKNKQEEQSRDDLLRFYAEIKDTKSILMLKTNSRKSLLKKLTSEYDPNVWYGDDGLPRNNVMPKGRIIGRAFMLNDKRIRVDLHWQKGNSDFTATELYAPEHPWYQSVLDDIGELNPGESVSVVEPFPKKPRPILPDEYGKQPESEKP